jgi:hypothetical protein
MEMWGAEWGGACVLNGWGWCRRWAGGELDGCRRTEGLDGCRRTEGMGWL